MEFINKELLQYCETHSAPESELLRELNRQTHLKVPQPRMLSGHIQGRILSMISKLMQPDFILEIGTYTGYSALCLAEGLKNKGQLFSMDVNEETMFFARKFIERAGLLDKIQLITGNATLEIPKLEHIWDIVFIDADKLNYHVYYDLVIDRVRSGGLIIADNVLWSGKILDPQQDKDTLAIHQFNEKVSKDPRVEALMMPVRDGLLMIRKK